MNIPVGSWHVIHFNGRWVGSSVYTPRGDYVVQVKAGVDEHQAILFGQKVRAEWEQRENEWEWRKRQWLALNVG